MSAITAQPNMIGTTRFVVAIGHGHHCSELAATTLTTTGVMGATILGLTQLFRAVHRLAIRSREGSADGCTTLRHGQRGREEHQADRTQ
jgi:hypothetical protein